MNRTEPARIEAAVQSLAAVPYLHTSPAAATRAVLDHLLLLANAPAVARLRLGTLIIYSTRSQRDERVWAINPPQAPLCWDSGVDDLGIELRSAETGEPLNDLVADTFGRLTAEEPAHFQAITSLLNQFPDLLTRSSEWLPLPPAGLVVPRIESVPPSELESLLEPMRRQATGWLETASRLSVRVARHQIHDLATATDEPLIGAEPAFNSGHLVIHGDLIHFPVLVGGTPWLVATMPFDPREWRHLQRIYLHSIPRLEARVRAAAKEAFFDRLVAPLRRALTERTPINEQLVERINQEWYKVAMVYPFPAPQLRITTPGETERDPLLLNGQPVRIEVLPEMARPLPPLFRYEPVSTAEVVERSRLLLQDYLRGRLASLDVIFGLGHELKNSLDQTKWASCFFHLSRHDPSKPLDPDLLQETLHGFRQLIWPVGLAAALRAIAKTDQGTDLRTEWLAPDWIADPDQPFPTEPVVAAYRATVRYLLDLLVSLEDRDQRIRLVESSSQDLAAEPLEALWERGAPAAKVEFDESRLVFPPLEPSGKEQVNAPYVLTGFVVEPIRNALSATLDAFRPPPLRSEIKRPLIAWQVRAGPDEVIFQIANPVSEDAQAEGVERLSHAAWLVSHLGRLLNVARLSGPDPITTADGARFVSFSVALYPQRLVRQPLDPNWTP